MFERLLATTALTAVEDTDETFIGISDEALECLVENLADVPADFVEMMRLEQTQRELQALIGAIRTHGVSPALMAFANYNNALSSTIPSIESFTGASSEQYAGEIIVALETLLEKVLRRRHEEENQKIQKRREDQAHKEGWNRLGGGGKPGSVQYKEDEEDRQRKFRQQRELQDTIAADAKRAKEEEERAAFWKAHHDRKAAATKDNADVDKEALRRKMDETEMRDRARRAAMVSGQNAHPSAGLSGGKIFGIVLGVIALIGGAILAYRAWKKWKDNKAAHIATVVPYSIVMKQLTGLAQASHICKQLEALTLPKTEEQWSSFQSRVDTIAAPLTTVGIRVIGNTVRTDELPAAVHDKIENHGYGEGSLTTIVDMVKKLKAVTTELGTVTCKELLHQIDQASPEERKFASRGYNLVDAVVHTTTIRMTKIMHRTKSVVDSIKGFYTT
jgi:hypothetical protein